MLSSSKLSTSQLGAAQNDVAEADFDLRPVRTNNQQHSKPNFARCRPWHGAVDLTPGSC